MTDSSASSYPEFSSKRAAWLRELLRERKTRESERAFVLEAVKPVLELLRGHASSVLEIIITPAFIESADQGVLDVLAQSRVRISLCRARTFQQLSTLTTAPGLLAIVRRTHWDEDAVLARPRVLGVLGECLQDPTNVGTIIRTALAFGVDGLWLTADSADVYNPKIVRATAGALLRMPVFMVTSTRETLARFEQHGCVLVASGSSAGQGIPIRKITSLPTHVMLAVGNESRGLSSMILNRASIQFHIPVNREVESLNVASATAIALYHFTGLRGEATREGREGRG